MTWLILIIVIVGGFLWFGTTAVRYSAERQVVETPSGTKIEILVHRDGVFLQTQGEAMLNLYTPIPVAIAVLRHGRKPWDWAVTVRGATLSTKDVLIHKVYSTVEEARSDAELLSQMIANGGQPWQADSMWRP